MKILNNKQWIQLNQHIATLNNKNVDLEYIVSKYKKQEIDLRDELESRSLIISDKEKFINDLKSNYQTLEKVNNDLKNNYQDLEKVNSKKENKIQKLQKEIEELRQRVSIEQVQAPTNAIKDEAKTKKKSVKKVVDEIVEESKPEPKKRGRKPKNAK